MNDKSSGSLKGQTRIKTLLGLFFLLLIFAIAFRVVTGVIGESQLKRTCRTADRVVVNLSTWQQNARNMPSFPSYEVADKKSAAELLNAIDLKTNWLPFVRCCCSGDILFEFYEGQNLLAKLSYHHGDALRWRNGPWRGDRDLTDGSKTAIEQWLKLHDCPTSDEARAIIAKQWKAHRASTATMPTSDGDS